MYILNKKYYVIFTIYTDDKMKTLTDIQQRKKYMYQIHLHFYQGWIAKCMLFFIYLNNTIIQMSFIK